MRYICVLQAAPATSLAEAGVEQPPLGVPVVAPQPPQPQPVPMLWQHQQQRQGLYPPLH